MAGGGVRNARGVLEAHVAVLNTGQPVVGRGAQLGRTEGRRQRRAQDLLELGEGDVFDRAIRWQRFEVAVQGQVLPGWGHRRDVLPGAVARGA